MLLRRARVAAATALRLGRGTPTQSAGVRALTARGASRDGAKESSPVFWSVARCRQQRRSCEWPAALLVARQGRAGDCAAYRSAALDETQAAAEEQQRPSANPKVALGDDDVAAIVEHSAAVRIRAHLDTLEAASISLAMFESLCAEHGLSQEQARDMLRSMHRAGVVLYMPEALCEELRDRVILEPEKLLPLLGSAFPPSIELRLRSELRELDNQLTAVSTELSSLEDRASRRATMVLASGLVAIAAQTGVYAWLTWFETSWEVMEPVCYFTTQGVMIGTIIYFLRNGSEHSLRHMWTNYRDRFMKGMLQRRNIELSWADVQRLQAAVEKKQKLLAGVRLGRE
uniref:Calcium uniporter protein C-terminal domain-containing protein n=1 Tax=Erythrolobus australicus TaxID=1077150 RepID=A0A7S1TMD9_9RHOD|mmetsp:Transcript_2246/g.6085  ORF Transcript_2246/g.6085 Transcript_2246/m.6085 type:complete len:344 (+) Transcript_2246:34-1065(+)